jgi:hypothetical protein
MDWLPALINVTALYKILDILQGLVGMVKGQAVSADALNCLPLERYC